MKTFVLFGSTGDLATRYVLPALGTLLQRGVYDNLICVGRRDWTRDDFRNFLAPYPDLLNHTETISYVRLDIEGESYDALKSEIEKVQNEGFENHELTYHLCLSPEYFVTVAQGLASVGLNTEKSIIMIEKPFGHDLKTAIALNLELQHLFRENQIYRVDHYLGKNYVRELFDYRLSQKGDWYNDRISEIYITARENITIEDRGEYYDKNGVTRDFLQNHLLQILAFSTMRMPQQRHDGDKTENGELVFEEDEIRDRIFQAISNVAPLLLDPRHDIVLGQYDGYREIPGVALDSHTPTYIKVQLTIDDTRWLDVKVILETGKALDRKESSVRFIFRDGSEKIFIESAQNKNNSYEILIEKALSRDASFFVRWDSVRAAWQVVNELLHCTDNCPLLQIYEPGEIPHTQLGK